MSSSAVRTAIKARLTANFPTEKVVDLTATFGELKDELSAQSVGMEDPWLGLQFVPSIEEPITVPSKKFREHGIVYIHVVDVAKPASRDSIISRAELIKNDFRAKRLSNVVILSVTPPNFELGATLQFDDGFIAASLIVEYQFDTDI